MRKTGKDIWICGGVEIIYRHGSGNKVQISKNIKEAFENASFMFLL